MAAEAQVDEEQSRRQRALLELARLDHRDLDGVFRATTEAASLILDVDRAGIWKFSADARSLVCEDLFLRRGGHSNGEVLSARDFPRYFEALAASRAVAADDAQQDPRTADLRDSYLRHHGIVSMLDVPIWSEGRVVGVVCSERVGTRRHWDWDDENFAASLADVAALAIEASARDLLQQRLREVLNAVTDAVFVIDREGNLTAMNQAAARFVARIGTDKLQEAVHRFEVLDIEGKLVPRESWPANRVLRGETVAGEVLGIRYKPDGEVNFARVYATPVYASGRLRSAVTVVTDVSHEVHLEYLKRDLLATLAHELKTPAAIAKGYAQYLARDTEVRAKWGPKLDAIDRAANRIDQLVSVLLTASSIMLGHLVLTQRRFDLVAQVRRSVAKLAPSSPRHAMVVTAPEIVLLYGDVPRIEQAIEQLLGNAIHFSPEGTEIRVTVEVRGASVILSIRDRGVGIPASEHVHIFSPYHRLERAERRIQGGLGIGLYVSREIVRAHGGDIWFESVEGEGTTFHVRLPLGEASR